MCTSYDNANNAKANMPVLIELNQIPISLEMVFWY